MQNSLTPGYRYILCTVQIASPLLSVAVVSLLHTQEVFEFHWTIELLIRRKASSIEILAPVMQDATLLFFQHWWMKEARGYEKRTGQIVSKARHLLQQRE